MSTEHEIAIIGSGFAGSLLARLLAHSGRDVVLLERGDHPRFALGESTTPLGNLVLERLATRYGQSDLYSLAAHGRWLRDLPSLGRGLKRGFTFYHHQKDQEFRGDSVNSRRLMVAASPDDAIADTHWLRSDVDHHLLRRAVAAGVRYLPHHEVVAVRETPGGIALRCVAGHAAGRAAGEDETAELEIRAEFAIDAGGRGSVLAEALGEGVEESECVRPLLYAHFEGVAPFRLAAGLDCSRDPYPEEWSAVHHLTSQGWMYQLRFDDGLTSVGVLVDDPKIDLLDPEGAFHRWISGYPSLGRQFEDARPVRPIALARPAGRARVAFGRRWALLPHAYAFFDPLFSTGIAWSLLGVERLVDILTESVPSDRGTSGWEALERYGDLLRLEAEHTERLIHTAQATLDDFELFVAWSHVYFRAASHAETVQRLFEPEEASRGAWAWQGFLGAEDEVIAPAVEYFASRVATLAGTAPSAERSDLLDSLRRELEPRNVAGLDDPERLNLYPVDFAPLVEHADRLGLTPAEVEERLPRLRSPASFAPEGRPG